MGARIEHFSQALKACEGSRQRLGRLAETARATATAFRECYAVGFKPSGRRVDAGARAPWELRRERSAVGDQRVAAVRSQPTMLVILDDPGADLRAYATALERLADAPEAVADALHDSDINAVLASCTFCGKRSRQVRRLIAGPEVLTCDQCVSTCVTVLEDELGSSWRERHDSA